jgi:RHS repeat-associated protein
LLNNLKVVAQGSLINRTFSYDSLSRMTAESHPEWGAGSQTTYAYNGDGLVTSRTRPAPNQTNTAVTITTNYGYDQLHRLSSRSYAGDTTGTASATFNYDESTAWSQTLSNTVGRLTTEFSGSTGQIFSYDSMGRPTVNYQCTPRVCGTTAYLLSYAYDLAGDRISASNGVGVTFSYSYNAATRLAGMTSSAVDAQHPATLLSNVHYAAFGPVSDTLGNGVSENFGYSSRGFPNSYSSAPYSFSITNIAGNGNITAANDSVIGTWTYGYDVLNHLTTSSKNSSPTQSFTYAYDRYGNRWQQNQTPTGVPSPQYNFDATTNRISGSGVLYDALGNVINDGAGNAYTYDAENRQIRVSGSAPATYTYDAENRRVKNGFMEFLYDLDGHAITMLEASTGAWDVGEIYAGPRHLATYSYGTTNFLHPDWLGTKRAMSNVSGAVSQTCANLPFGDGAQCTGSTEWGYMHFTDDYHDSEDNLEHTWFRQYSSAQGRWMRPDPYGGSMDLSNPQSLNRYAYVTNNPINAIDPSGLDDGNKGGPFGAAGCTLLSGNGDEAFGCAGINNFARSGGGFSLGILGPGFGGGFGGIPIPGCLLPGECSITLPNAGLGGLLPQLPDTQCEFGACANDQSGIGNGFEDLKGKCDPMNDGAFGPCPQGNWSLPKINWTDLFERFACLAGVSPENMGPIKTNPEPRDTKDMPEKGTPAGQRGFPGQRVPRDNGAAKAADRISYLADVFECLHNVSELNNNRK